MAGTQTVETSRTSTPIPPGAAKRARKRANGKAGKPKAVKAKSAKTAKAKVAKAAKPEKAAKRDIMAKLPAIGELKLIENGLGGSDSKNRYVNIEFTNGFSVRLLPVGYPKGEVKRIREVRDLISAWLRKHVNA